MWEIPLIGGAVPCLAALLGTPDLSIDEPCNLIRSPLNLIVMIIGIRIGKSNVRSVIIYCSSAYYRMDLAG